MPRVYNCCHGCGYHRSRKAQVLEHEKSCKFGILDRVIAENEALKEKVSKQDIVLGTLTKNLEVLMKQVSGLMRRKKRDDKNASIYNFDWQKDFRFERSFFEKVGKATPNMSSIMDTMIQHYFDHKPVFYKIGKQNKKLEVKGVIGLINRQSVGVDNVLTSVPFGRFYTVLVDMLIDELMDHHITVALEADDKAEANEELSSRLMKTMNLMHYRPKINDPRHNKMYKICRSRTIDVIYEAMKKRIKKEKVVVL